MSSDAEFVAFLEVFPLYRKRDFTKPKPPEKPASSTRKSNVSDGPPAPYGFHLPEVVRIAMPCGTCRQTRTFAWPSPLDQQDHMMGRILLGGPTANVMESGSTCQLQFLCTHCSKQKIAFLLRVDRVDSGGVEGFSLQKAGQWPCARPTISRSLERALGEPAASLYKQGLTAEGHSFGIGSFAYYRRVAEDTIARLLTGLRTYADEHGMDDVVAALDRVATETQASKRIEAVKDILPSALRPNGMNPLGTIYQAVSQGLHGETDEDCLDLAGHLRTALDFLIVTIEEHKATAEKYSAAIKGLQNAKKPS